MDFIFCYIPSQCVTQHDKEFDTNDIVRKKCILISKRPKHENFKRVKTGENMYYKTLNKGEGGEKNKTGTISPAIDVRASMPGQATDLVAGFADELLDGVAAVRLLQHCDHLCVLPLSLIDGRGGGQEPLLLVNDDKRVVARNPMLLDPFRKMLV